MSLNYRSLRSISAALSVGLFAACSDDSDALQAGSLGPPTFESGELNAGERADGSGDGDSASEGPRSGRETEDLLVSAFVDASKDPFSTFGADVDTASYDYFRQSLHYGSLPSASYVRAEDFVNFFNYAYEAPAADSPEPFAIDLAAGVHPIGRGSMLLRVGIQAKAPPPSERKPANLIFLVDVSGSMASPNKLPYVKVVLSESLATLAPTDTVSIVSYAADTRVRLPPTPVSQRAKIEKVIDALESSGGTNGASGINLAYEQAAAGFLEGGINHVILCTDGDFNLGVTSDVELVKLIKQKRASGVTLTALGFGNDNLNDSMMEKVSNAGNGIYSVIFSQDQAVEYANERLLGTVTHVAKDMKIQVEFNPAEVRAYRLIGYENRAIADDDFRDDTVDAGEVGANHRVTALYEIVRAGQEIPLPAGAPALSLGEQVLLAPEITGGELVRVKIRYKQPGATDEDPASEVVRSLAPDAMVLDAGQLNPDLSWAAAVAVFAEHLRKSPFAQASELDRIGAIVEAQKERDGDRAEFAALFAQARSLMQP